MNHPLPRGWKEVRLGDIAVFETGTSKSKYIDNNGKYIIIDMGAVSEEGKIIANKKTNFNQEFIKKNSLIMPKDDIGNGKIIGKTAVIDIDNLYILGDHVFQLTIKNNNPYFISYCINSHDNNKQIRRLCAGSLQIGLSKKSIENVKIKIPPLDEQKRIADILSTFDDLIENLNKLIEKKEIYKKGVMQRVLTGKVRFNGFTDEWEEVYIKDVGTIITGNTPSTKDKSFWGGKHVWVTPTDINKKDIDNSERKLTDIGLSKARKLPKNTLLVTCIASIGKNSILRCEGSCNQQINAIIPNKNFSAEFLYYIFENNKEYLNAKAPASATKIISKTEFEKLSFIFPKIEEQNKIAELLTLIDKDIDSLKQILHLRKLQKKGVMQKLLTGEVRV